MELIENVANRYIKVSNEGKVSYKDEIEILEHILNKLKPISKAEYAKKENISIPAVTDRINRGKVMCIDIINRTFIFE